MWKHRRPYYREYEDSDSKNERNCMHLPLFERDYTHPPLFELCRRIGEEKHRGEQNSIREVLTGNTPGTAGSRWLLAAFAAASAASWLPRISQRLRTKGSESAFGFSKGFCPRYAS